MSARNTKAFVQQKRHRRQWIAFVRMCRYGINNFSRNAWLTIAATAVMTITLVIIFVTIVAQNVLNDTIKQISTKVDMSIYVKGDTSDRDARAIADDLRQLSNVDQVVYIDATKAREEFVEQNKSDAKTLEALNNATNKFFGTFRINLKDINDVSQLDAFVKDNERYKKAAEPDRQPSFAGPRRDTIKKLAQWTDFAQKFGISASVLFVAISSLIVFNTIRMAIFNRKDEIEMMKLIGADRGFIRGPFVVEAMVYGFIAGVLATILGGVTLTLTKSALVRAGVTVQPTIDFITTFAPFVLLGMIVLGALVGAISSLLATQRYLKI